MKFKTNEWRVINRDWIVYVSNNWVIELPENIGIAYKLESLEKKVTPKIKKKN